MTEMPDWQPEDPLADDDMTVPVLFNDTTDTLYDEGDDE